MPRSSTRREARSPERSWSCEARTTRTWNDVADEAGRVVFPGIQPGTWSLTGSLSGFLAENADAVVPVGGSADAVLELPLDYGITETVVVVGSRRTDEQRSVTSSAVPVDVLTAEALTAQPRGSLADAVRTLAPSFNVNLQPISDAATVIRPVNLRNLAPDHILVLVNGKRRHRGAVIAWLGNGIADGSQGPDMSVIPAIAIRQAELLRDGAAAQYGSDAIAGVINFQLKDAREGGGLELRSGLFQDRNAGNRSTCGANSPGSLPASCNAVGDRAGAYSFAGNVGLPIGNAGFANLSMEYGGEEPTNRAVQREDASALALAGAPRARDTAQVWGSPLIENDLKTFANFGTTLASGLRPYAHANYASRRATGGFYYRHPHTRSGVFQGPVVDGRPTLLVGDREWARTRVPGAGGCPPVPIIDGRPDPAALAAVENDPSCFTLYSRFPGGFTPQFGGLLTDHSVVAGVQRTSSAGFTWDASAGIGRSRIDQFIYNTVNASLGYETPTSFDPGSYEQHETNLNFDVAGPVGDRVHVAAGVGAPHRTVRDPPRRGRLMADRPLRRAGLLVRVERVQRLPGGHDRRGVGPVVGRHLRRHRAVRRRGRPLDPGRRASLRALRRLRTDPQREGDRAVPAGAGTRSESRDLDRVPSANTGPAEHVQRHDGVHRRRTHEQRRGAVNVEGRPRTGRAAAPARDLHELQGRPRRRGRDHGPDHRLLPDRRRRPPRPLSGNPAAARRDRDAAGRGHRRSPQLPGVPILS